MPAYRVGATHTITSAISFVVEAADEAEALAKAKAEVDEDIGKPVVTQPFSTNRIDGAREEIESDVEWGEPEMIDDDDDES